MHYAVTIEAIESRVLATEVVVEANSLEEAYEAARELFLEVSENPDNWTSVSQQYNLEMPRQIDLADDEEEAPYVFDTLREKAIHVRGSDWHIFEDEEFNIPVEENETFFGGTQGFTIIHDDGPEPEDEAQEWFAAQTYPRYVPVIDTFETRPTADLTIPLTTLDNGYTPMDGEFVHRVRLPYFLDGPVTLKFGHATYGEPRLEVEEKGWFDDCQSDDDYYDEYEE